MKIKVQHVDAILYGLLALSLIAFAFGMTELPDSFFTR